MTRRSLLALALVAAPLAAGGGCSSGESVQCRSGADCASGACDVSGRCVAVQAPDGSVPADAATGADGALAEDGSDAGASSDAPSTVDGGGVCTPNHDGTVTRAEVPLAAGLHAKFRIAQNATWDTTGVQQPDGTRTWDLSGSLPGDHDVEVTTDALAGAWYAADFTGATYTTRLSDSQDLLGVFQVADAALSLQGVVSPSKTNTYTELSYAPAVTTLSFPFQKGTAWTTRATVTGTAQGIPNTTYFEQYDSKVDATGTLKTPYATFQVLRVHTVLTRTVGALVTITRSDAFVAECFGPVAAVTSQTNEPSDEFSNDAEVRRLAP